MFTWWLKPKREFTPTEVLERQTLRGMNQFFGTMAGLSNIFVITAVPCLLVDFGKVLTFMIFISGISFIFELLEKTTDIHTLYL